MYLDANGTDPDQSFANAFVILLLLASAHEDHPGKHSEERVLTHHAKCYLYYVALRLRW